MNTFLVPHSAYHNVANPGPPGPLSIYFLPCFSAGLYVLQNLVNLSKLIKMTYFQEGWYFVKLSKQFQL